MHIMSRNPCQLGRREPSCKSLRPRIAEVTTVALSITLPERLRRVQAGVHVL